MVPCRGRAIRNHAGMNGHAIEQTIGLLLFTPRLFRFFVIFSSFFLPMSLFHTVGAEQFRNARYPRIPTCTNSTCN